MQRVKVFNTFISKGTFGEFIESIFKLNRDKSSSYVCFANVHMIMEAYKDAEFNDVLAQADIITPDGAPVSKMMSYIYKYKTRESCGNGFTPISIS